MKNKIKYNIIFLVQFMIFNFLPLECQAVSSELIGNVVKGAGLAGAVYLKRDYDNKQKNNNNSNQKITLPSRDLLKDPSLVQSGQSQNQASSYPQIWMYNAFLQCENKTVASNIHISLLNASNGCVNKYLKCLRLKSNKNLLDKQNQKCIESTNAKAASLTEIYTYSTIRALPPRQQNCNLNGCKQIFNKINIPPINK